MAKKGTKYYYLKLKQDFYDREEIRILESMPDGFLYSNILMKLYLRSLTYDGRLMFRGVIPYTPEILAPIVNHPTGVVKAAVDIFKQLGLVEVLDNGAIYMLDIENFVGNSSDEADRIRAHRSRIKQEEEQLKLEKGEQNGVHLYDICTPTVREVYATSTQNEPKEAQNEGAKGGKSIFQTISETLEPQGIGELSTGEAYKCTTEIRDKRLEIRDNNNNILSSSTKTTEKIPYPEIIDYLNDKANRSYQPHTKATRQLIKARYAEGFRLDDFKRVIDGRVAKWANDPKMMEFLRPQTLFGTKFESYLNDANMSSGPTHYNVKQPPAPNVPEWAKEEERAKIIRGKNLERLLAVHRDLYETYQADFQRISRKAFIERTATPEEIGYMDNIAKMEKALERTDFFDTKLYQDMFIGDN